MNNKFPEAIKSQIALYPEYRQGTNKVKVTLRDGREFSSVYVAWGDEVVKVGSGRDIPFDPAEVVQVENDL
jgi:hypothetical protein